MKMPTTKMKSGNANSNMSLAKLEKMPPVAEYKMAKKMAIKKSKGKPGMK